MIPAQPYLTKSFEEAMTIYDAMPAYPVYLKTDAPFLDSRALISIGETLGYLGIKAFVFDTFASVKAPIIRFYDAADADAFAKRVPVTVLTAEEREAWLNPPKPPKRSWLRKVWDWGRGR